VPAVLTNLKILAEKQCENVFVFAERGFSSGNPLFRWLSTKKRIFLIFSQRHYMSDFSEKEMLFLIFV